MKKVLYFFSLLFICYTSNGQFVGLVINEFSQGSSGNKDYIEFIVVGKRTCNDSTADLRGWIFDDQNGWYGTESNAPGHYRFNINNPTWSAVPFGSLIVVYNPLDKNTALPSNDIVDPLNFKYIVAINGSNLGTSLFQQENSIPAKPNSVPLFATGLTYIYPDSSNTSNYSPAGNQWNFTISINESSTNTPGDVLSIISPSKRDDAFFSIGHKYPQSAPFRAPTVSLTVVQGGNVAFLTDANYKLGTSWSIQPVATGETPGVPNGGENSTWINSMRIPATPPLVTVTPPAASLCGNADSATLTASGADSYVWSPTIGLSAATGAIVKAKPSTSTTYTVVGTKDGCTGMATIDVVRTNEPIALNQRFCKLNNPTIDSLKAIGVDVKWYNNLTDALPLPRSTPLSDKSYFATQTINGCESARKPINVSFYPTPVVSISATPFCANNNTGGEVVFTGTPFATVTYTQNGNSFSITIPGDGILKISPGVISQDITYVLTRISTANCTSTANGSATIKYVQVQKPVVSSDQLVCGFPKPKISDLKPSGNNYNWYNTNNVSDVTPLSPSQDLLGKNYFVSQKDLSSGCESERVQVYTNIDVVTSPSANAQAFCMASNPTVADLKGNNMILRWYEKPDDDHSKPLPPEHALTTKTYYARQFSDPCYSENIIPVSITVEPSPVAPSATVSQQPKCGTGTGAISILSPAKANGIEFRVQNGAFFASSPDPEFTNLPPGTYNISYKINGQCISFTTTVVIDNPAMSTVTATASAQPIPCGQSTGSITVIASNGTAPYSYSINNGTSYQESNIFSNLSAGSHTIRVKDSYGCSYDVSTTITQNNSTVTATVSAQPIPCGHTTGSINVTAANGTAPYFYSINNGATYQQSNIFSNLPAGSYTIKVKDNNGCTYDASTDITQNNSSLTATANAQPIACGQSTGSINVTASNGTAPYTYSIDNGTSYQQSNIFSNLSAGSYTINVKDNNGCAYDVTTTISQNNSTLTASVNATEMQCGETSATITVTPSNGAAPYTFSINNGTSYQPNNTFTNLTPGTYTIRVKDNNGCTYDVSSTIAASKLSVIASASSTDTECGRNNGSITASGSGGSSSYTYSLNSGTFESNNVFKNLSAGTYKVTVKNAAGCSDDTTIVIRQSKNAVSQSSSISGCKSVTFNGVTYTSSTVVRDTIRTALNCDSLYRVTNINVQIIPAVTRTATVDGCDSVVFNSITYRSSTVVRDTLKTTLGCDSVYIITNIKITTFTLSLTASATPAFAGTTVFLSTNSNIGYQSISWTPSHLFPFQNASSQRIIADSSRTIKVIAESNSGCIDTAQLFVEVKEFTDFFVPNAFSPNGDGKNDVFLLMGTTISKGKVRVFNQWGEMLFTTDDLKKGWDGNAKGRPQPVGIYVYEVHVTMHNGTEVRKKGFINLIR